MGLLRDKTKWHWYSPWPWSKILTVSGKLLSDYTMRRLINGDWEYRDMTQTEIDERKASQQW